MSLAPKDGHLYGFDVATEAMLYRTPVTRIENADEKFSTTKSVHFCHPYDPDMQPACRVGVDVQRFEATLGEGVVVEALWSVRPAMGETRAGRSLVQEAARGNGYEALVAAYSRALAAVSADIAAAVRAAHPTGG